VQRLRTVDQHSLENEAIAAPPKKNLAASSSTSTYAAPSMAAHFRVASLSASGPSYLPLW